MPREIVITSSGEPEAWSRQFCRRVPWAVALGNASGYGVASQNRSIVMLGSDTRSGVVTAFTNAARAAGPGGRILYNHGLYYL